MLSGLVSIWMGEEPHACGLMFSSHHLVILNDTLFEVL